MYGCIHHKTNRYSYEDNNIIYLFIICQNRRPIHFTRADVQSRLISEMDTNRPALWKHFCSNGYYGGRQRRIARMYLRTKPRIVVTMHSVEIGTSTRGVISILQLKVTKHLHGITAGTETNQK